MALVVPSSTLPRASTAPEPVRPAAARPARPAPRRPEGDLDGFLVGAKGATVAPGTPLDRMEKIVPRTGKPQSDAIFVNGVANTAKDQADAMEALADATGLAFVGVHNATNGLVSDVGEAILQKLGFENDARPTQQLAKVIVERLDAHQPLTLVAHSQGALMVSEAIRQAQATLVKRGLSQADAETAMADLHVETFASAAGSFPDGPKYVHYINDSDFVPSWFGTSDPPEFYRPAPAWGRWIDNALGSVGILSIVGRRVATTVRSTVESTSHPGRGAAVIHFKDDGAQAAPGESLAAHRLSTYLQHRLPFDEARLQGAS